MVQYFFIFLQVIGDGSEHCSMDVQPVTGRIDPGLCKTVAVSLTWNKTVRE